MKPLLYALLMLPAAAGAEHWAFQPIEKPDVPAGEHPIDYFIKRKLDKLGFEPSPKADHPTLVRRAFYNLIGLPPNDFETEYEDLIDKLLASPHYGERWARHWLDVARYADTKDGVLMYGDNRIRPFAYTYRDYVIRAFNADKPFDQFVREQLAADHLGLNDELAAMGFLTLGRMFDNNRYDVIDDQIDVVTRGLLGLTVSCARCHDHKYDPIPTTDYYSLYGVFANSEPPLDRPVVENIKDNGIEHQYAKKVEELRELRAKRHQQLIVSAKNKTPEYIEYAATTEPTVSETAQFFLSLQPEDLRPQIINRWRNLLSREPEIRQLQDRLADEFHTLLPNERPPWEIPLSQTWYYMSRKDKDAYRGKLNNLDVFATQSKTLAGRAMSLVDSPEIVEPAVFNRGNPSQPGSPIERRFLSILDNDKSFKRGSGRLELANAIADPENPLTARVIVNRIWMHHLGRPLVETPSDFGIRTPPPTHPKLLDYLASELMENGWRLKPIHRLIMTSQAYQRTSIISNSDQQLQDPENRWLWRGTRRRLDLESMRDTVLAMSGQLDPNMFGRPTPITSSSNTRRTIYALIERQNSPEIFRVFDFANPDVSCAQRNETTVPQQALFALNSRFMKRAAESVCKDRTVAELHQHILRREPTDEEWSAAAEFLESSSFADYAQTLLITNEIMFVD